MLKTIASFLVVLILAIALVQRPAEATLLIPTSLPELAASARVILHGTVVDVRAQWAEGRRRIESLVTLDVERYLKGDFGPTVIVKVQGGKFGAYRTIVVGAPTFEVGDETVLFVGSSGPAYPYIIGLNQGVFRVVTAKDGRALVMPPLIEAQGPEAVRVVRGDLARRPIALEQFVTSVRDLVRLGAK